MEVVRGRLEDGLVDDAVVILALITFSDYSDVLSSWNGKNITGFLCCVSDIP